MSLNWMRKSQECETMISQMKTRIEQLERELERFKEITYTELVEQLTARAALLERELETELACCALKAKQIAKLQAENERLKEIHNSECSLHRITLDQKEQARQDTAREIVELIKPDVYPNNKYIVNTIFECVDKIRAAYGLEGWGMKEQSEPIEPFGVSCQTKEQVTNEFKAELQALLNKYGAELKVKKDYWLGHAECGEDVRMTVDIPELYDTNYNCCREYTEIDLGSYMRSNP